MLLLNIHKLRQPIGDLLPRSCVSNCAIKTSRNKKSNKSRSLTGNDTLLFKMVNNKETSQLREINDEQYVKREKDANNGIHNN